MESENRRRSIPPEQSADVITWYFENANREARSSGWRDKVSIGEIAIRVASKDYSILPDETPMLTPVEAYQALQYLGEVIPDEGPNRSESYYAELDRRVDTQGISYDEARRQIEAEGWTDE